ncbi:hypothetical protein F4805DRAFT_455565 [Annulohypoxylon moriforme]|nr:hypothetical protein F4805DRAFT_455565 [Annulohypoxylon moriforme]
MASLQGAYFSQNPIYRWDPILDSRRNLSNRYDEPFVNIFSEQDLASNFIASFMQSCDERNENCRDNDSCNYTTKAVVKFCEGADFAALQHNICATTELVALLGDGVGSTAMGLYQALMKPKEKIRKIRMYIRDGRIYKTTGVNSSLRHNTIGSQEQHAEIRRVYIASLTPWIVVALAASAPHYQAGILGKFISNHLRFGALISAIINPHFTFFALEFQLPYFALRKHRLPQKDARKLRLFEDITFLRTMGDKTDNSPSEYIYESKLSCLISGPSRYSWSGFLINDQYFETEDESESVAEYIDQGKVGILPDPFAAGKRPLGDLPSDPREHFLIALEIRLRQVGKEWCEVSMTVDETIKLYGRDFWERKICGRSYGDGLREASDTDGHRSRLRGEHQEWMRRIVELLRKFINTLNQYSDKWKAFSDTGQNYFTSTDDADYSEGLRKNLIAVHTQIIELEGFRSSFKHTLDYCEDMSRNFNLRIALEGNESALFQQKTARDVKVLTWITFLSLPFALAASLLSTQEGYIPISPSPGALLASIAVLETAIWLVLGSLLGWDWFRTLVNSWLPYQFRSREAGIAGLESRQSDGLT